LSPTFQGPGRISNACSTREKRAGSSLLPGGSGVTNVMCRGSVFIKLSSSPKALASGYHQLRVESGFGGAFEL
jgi:hypothetical protein